MSANAVRAENLHKSYILGATAVGALRGVDLLVQHGEFVALMGPSGCGKTTLLNLIAAIDTPSRGNLLVDDVGLDSLSDDQLADLRRDRIGVVFQFYNLLPTLSARENIELPMHFKGATPNERRVRADALLERVGLKDRAEHKPAELSGGEQQRVSIARALANRPALVLLDEPTGDLDTATGEEIMTLLRDLNVRDKVTLIVATHDPLVAQASSRIVRLRDGKIENPDAAGSAGALAGESRKINTPAREPAPPLGGQTA